MLIKSGSLAAIIFRDGKSPKEDAEVARKARKKQLEAKREQRLKRGAVQFRPVTQPILASQDL